MSHLRSATRLAAALSLFALIAPVAALADFASPDFLPGRVVVQYRTSGPAARAHTAGAGYDDADPQVLRLSPHASVARALSRLRHDPRVLWAAPDPIAHAISDGPAGAPASDQATASQAAPAPQAPAAGPVPPAGFIPNDPGVAGMPGGWTQLQWNFAGPFGVGAPQAWQNLIADGHPGGAGVVIAVLDTGVAYENRGRFRRSPDFTAGQFVAGYDFVSHSPYALDHNGHGTHVAATLAEATDNGIGLTGLAYGAHIMPVRVLDGLGEGDAATIARGVRFAVDHGARILNLSLEFSSDLTADDIPELLSALRYAHRRGALVVAASGNEGSTTIAYPARAPDVVRVGATTEHGCLASFSNDGRGLTLVAPGGGSDASLPGDPDCRPAAAPGRDIYQITLSTEEGSPKRFGIPSGYIGTSMAAPHVSATAALVIASGVLGRHPTPAQLVARLRATARPLGPRSEQHLYGAGLLDAAAATAPGGPGAVSPPPAKPAA